MHKAYVALGSNLSNPETQLKKAFLALKQLKQTSLVQQSSLYRTAPVGYDNQPDFINAVAEVRTELTPEALLTALFGIEQDFGRERPFANAPRVLDLDLLWYEGVELASDFITIPHPRMHERGFVLLPLAEIAPNLVLTKHGNVVKLAARFQNEGITKLKH